MEFLYKLYDQEYFGIILFTAITILAFLFLIILFFGKKDEKQRKIEETKQLNLANGVTNENVEENSGIPEIQQPVIENTITPKEEEPTFVNPFENNEMGNVSENVTPVVEDSSIVDTPVADIPVINNMDEMFNTSLEDMTLESNEDAISEIVEPEVNNIEEIPFTSITNQEETNIFNESNEEKSDIFANNETKEEQKSIPPMFELPKMAEPKEEKVEETTDNSTTEEVSNFDNILDNIEQEVYNIDK